MKLVVYGLSGVLGLLGLVFLLGHQGETSRLVVGGALLIAGVALAAVMRLRPQVVRVEQNLDLGTPSALKKLSCEKCGAGLESKHVEIKDGAPWVSCPFCNTDYQLEEALKW